MKYRLQLMLACLFVLPALASTFGQEQRPNVLFVSVDDLNDWIEPLGGHPQADTPNFARFMKRSVCFTNASCPSPGCNPSRTAIMTGLAPYSSGVYSNYQDWREVIPNRQTIGAYFRQHGYFSCGAGKIFHYHMVDPECWDEYWPSQQKNMPNEVFPDFAKSTLATANTPTPKTMSMPAFHHMYGMFDWSALDAPDEQMGDFKSVDYVLRQLNKPRDKPLFLACGIYRPHLPWYVPRKYFDLFPLNDVVLPKRLENDLADVGPRARDISQIKKDLATEIPVSPAPLVKTSEKLQQHHIPPFRSRSEYDDWLQHEKDNQYLLNKYWQ